MAKAEIVRYAIGDDRIVVWTTSDRKWEVRRSKKDGAIYCTCPAWRFRKSRGEDTCKHCVAVLNAGIQVPEFKGDKKMKVFGVSLGTGNGEEEGAGK
jgi:predicted nucleic acid-binding Zn finger protein